MMKKYLMYVTSIVLMAALVSLLSCDKKEEYELRFTCTSSNPYEINVDGNSDIVSGGSFKNYTLEEGTYSWKVEQQSGYIAYPTVKEGTVNLKQDKEIVFP